MHPQGPVYVGLDAGIQETPLPREMELPPTLAVPVAPAADPAALRRVADALLASERPAIVCGYVGRTPETWHPLIELAEALGAGVVDSNMRLSFPSRHSLNITGTDLVERADVVLLLDVKDVGAHTGLLDKHSPGLPPRLAPGATLLDIGFGDLELSAWASHQGALYRPDLQVIADTTQAIPALLELVAPATSGRSAWRAEIDHEVGRRRADWQRTASDHGERIRTAWLVDRVGKAIDGFDWVLAAGNGAGWANRLWDMDEPHRHAGRSLGTATQIGIATGVALAHRSVPGRLVVDIQPDGDLLYDPGALWTAAHHQIPMLVVMMNNRLYGNDLGHQREMATTRGRPIDRAHIGISLTDPAVDFAALARSMGWMASGPIASPGELDEALALAVRSVIEQQRPVLVDVIVES
jgi:benzoylformate decarboxylase/acetolactate synthase-1/2/3 large subunit